MAKKEKKLTTDEALAKVFEISLNYINESDNIYMNMLNNRANFISNQIKDKYEYEPPKMFKKTHKKWEDEIAKLENELMETYKKVEEVLKENKDFFEKLKAN